MCSVHRGDLVEPLTSDLSRVSPSPSWFAGKRRKRKGKRRNTKVSVAAERERRGRGGVTEEEEGRRKRKMTRRGRKSSKCKRVKEAQGKVVIPTRARVRFVCFFKCVLQRHNDAT